MLEVGDRVILNPKLKNIIWYTDEPFIIISVNKKHRIITLNKNLLGYGNIIFPNHLLMDETYYRKEKLLKIKNKIKHHGI